MPQREDAGRQDLKGQLAGLNGLVELLKPLLHVSKLRLDHLQPAGQLSGHGVDLLRHQCHQLHDGLLGEYALPYLLDHEVLHPGGIQVAGAARPRALPEQGAADTVERVRRRCVEEGIEAALDRKQQLRRRQKKLDGAAEARLIALACGEPPEGRACWTLRLLADRLVECEIVESIHPETVRKALKKTNSSPG